jgi:hypothetical protein
MTFYVYEGKPFSCDIIFENVTEFEIGCKGLTTPLSAFAVVKTAQEFMKYRICSLEDDDINFYCESFRIINAQYI